MASNDSSNINSIRIETIVKKDSNKLSYEHEDIVKTHEMAAKKLSSSIDGKDNPIEEFDNISEDKLKSLLDEALDYKNPPDAIDKSDMFQQMLKSAKEEEERENLLFELNGFGTMKQSNSLQNLRDECYQQQMNINQTYSSSKKHHRRKNNSTSVSTRRLEGGSLPVDMHHSLTDQPFLSEFKNSKKRKEKQKETVIDIGDYETDEKKLMQRSFDSTMKDSISSSYPNDGIEMKSMCYTNSVDLEVQDQSKYSSAPQKISTISTMRNSDSNQMTSGKIEYQCDDVDKTIQFSTLEKPTSYQQQHQLDDYLSNGSTINHSNNIVVANSGCNYTVSTPFQLGSSYNSVTSVASEKIISQSQKSGFISKSGETIPLITRPNSSSNDKNCYEINSKYGITQPANLPKDNNTTIKFKAKRTSKSDRSFASIRQAKDIEGYQGDKDVDELLKYIEDGDGDAKKGKSNSKNGILSNDFMSADDKKKKMTLKNKEKVNKLKKSNSCDELCSTGRQKQQEEKEKSSQSTAANENNFNEEVTLRSKSSNLTSGAKKGDNKSDQSQSKRNERRSWGTEGLRTTTSTTTTNNNETNSEQQEIDSSSSSCSHQSEAHIESLSAGEQSLPTDEFQPVVIKKRKVKRKSSEAGDAQKPSNTNIQTYKRDGKFSESNVRPGLRHTSDRDNKNSKSGKSQQESKASKSRRKSTSSMPPSEDEYHSDGNDSVQSLPIENTKSTSSPLFERKRDAKQHQNSQKQNKQATFSYADIAKTSTNRHNSGGSNSNGGMTPSIDKWPSITSSSVSSHQSNTNNNINDPFSKFEQVSKNQQPQSHQQQQQIQKLSSASSTLVKKLSYPELVENNNNKNKQLNSVQSSMIDVNGGEKVMMKQQQLLNGVDSFDSNNNTDNQKISYSQSLLDNTTGNELTDANGNSVVKTDIINKQQPMLTKSKSVDHNNFSSIEQYPALERAPIKLDKINKTLPLKQQHLPSIQQNQQQQQQQQLKQMTETIKQPKKLKKLASPPQTTNVTTWPNPASTASVTSNCRPAVIILNDCAKPNEVDCGITFGFDINEHLLFGHQNGDSSAVIMDQRSTCTNDISLETNNNNNCDITNTNLSNNNLNNQIAPAESFESLTTTQSSKQHQQQFINESQNTIVSEQCSSSLSLLSPPKHQQQLNNVLDISSHSSNNNDHGYLSSSLLTNSTSPPLPAVNNNNNINNNNAIPSDEFAKSVKTSDLVLPHFLSPQSAKFANQVEVVSFVSEEWTKVMRKSKVFECPY